jgi:hypothetical protein
VLALLFTASCGARTSMIASDAAVDVPSLGDAGVAILFGGVHPTADFLADTWTWNGTAWTELATPGPPSRASAAMAALNGKVFLFGGFSSGGVDNEGLVPNDTWEWDGAAWTNLHVAGPPARLGAVMAPLDGKLVLFGGNDYARLLSDTWTWDGVAWKELDVAGPPARDLSVMVPLGGKLVLFGGDDGGPGALSDTWTWDGTAWTEITVTGPSPRFGAVMAPLDGKLILFGGGTVLDLSDTWSWDGTAWTELDVAGPGKRLDAVMAPLGGELVLFGGDDVIDGIVSTGTWTWDGATWKEVSTTGPSTRYAAVMATP